MTKLKWLILFPRWGWSLKWLWEENNYFLSQLVLVALLGYALPQTDTACSQCRANECCFPVISDLFCKFPYLLECKEDIFGSLSYLVAVTTGFSKTRYCKFNLVITEHCTIHCIHGYCTIQPTVRRTIFDTVHLPITSISSSLADSLSNTFPALCT